MDFLFIPVREWGLARAQEIHFNQSGYELLNLENGSSVINSNFDSTELSSYITCIWS